MEINSRVFISARSFKVIPSGLKTCIGAPVVTFFKWPLI